MTEKRFNVFDVDGTVFLEDHKEGSYHIGEKENVDIPCLNDIADRLNTYADENEKLKEDNMLLIDDSEKYRKLSIQFDNRNKELISENEQLKSEKEHYKKQVDELDGLLNKYEITFEELEEILGNDYRERF